MITRKDVIRLYVPHPTDKSGLAVKPHMYICRTENFPSYCFLKCQTAKPITIQHHSLQHFVDELPNANRNPFFVKTRIDCDKVFLTSNTQYSNDLLTTIRSNVCEDIMLLSEKELQLDGFRKIHVNETKLQKLNQKVTKYR